MPMKLCLTGKHFYDAGENQDKQCPECQKDQQHAVNSENLAPGARIPTDEAPRPRPDFAPGAMRTKEVDPKNRPRFRQGTDTPAAGHNQFQNATQPTPDNQYTVIIQPDKKPRPTGPQAHRPVTDTEEPPTAPKEHTLITDPNDLPTAGWLVIVDGPGRGRDFRLIQGENRIGRDRNMEVCLDFGDRSDATVSRETHALVVYDIHANVFFIERGRSRNLPLLNNQIIRRDQNLAARDIIQVGQTRLLFVPLCDEQFQW